MKGTFAQQPRPAARTTRPAANAQPVTQAPHAPRSGQHPNTRLRIGNANDALEHEAHRAADAVTAAPAATVGASAPPSLSAVNGRASPASTHATPAPASVAAVLASRGDALAPTLRRDMERHFGHDFSQVRVHADTRAAASVREVHARAWTVGRHIAFGSGRYQPEAPSGRRLLAHELAHVVQQRNSAANLASAFGTAEGQPRATADSEIKTLQVPGEQAEQLLQRDVEGAGTVADSPSPPPADTAGAVPAQSPPATGPATPTLSVTPAATLTRGDTLTATIGFTPRAGETKNIVAWRYATPNQGSVTRAATEASFQTNWSGAMALSGTLEVDYTVTPAGSAASAVSTLTQGVTVNDRSGAPWAAAADLRAENAFTGRPDPPKVFSDLGRHNLTITNPTPTATAVAAGPNTGFSFVGSLTAGTYISQPRIHPALTNATSSFNTFHQNPSRLYLLVGAARTLIPITEYSALSTAGGTLVFTVPSWETFYKARRFYEVTATSPTGAGPVPLRNAWWGLASNSATAALSVLDAVAIRGALGIPATEGFSLSATARGSWEGFQLMQSAAILTGTQSHEYVHATHSHRANFTAMLRAVDPQRKLEQTVSTPSNSVTFADKVTEWVAEIQKPNHELVDEAASRTAGAFVATGSDMAGVNTDPASGTFLGSVWNITDDAQMAN